MPWRVAVEPFGDGVSLLLVAQPGAKRARFPDGFNQWRGRIGVAICAPARDGEANMEVLQLVAEWFGKRTADLTLVAGSTTRRKRVIVRGLDSRVAIERLEAVM